DVEVAAVRERRGEQLGGGALQPVGARAALVGEAIDRDLGSGRSRDGGGGDGGGDRQRHRGRGHPLERAAAALFAEQLLQLAGVGETLFGVFGETALQDAA